MLEPQCGRDGGLRMEQGPEICVVMPTHNRRDLVLEALGALARQTLAPERFEVVVAMDAVVDGTEEAIAERPWPFAIRTVVPHGRGAAATRNAGAALALAPRLVFLDDDIRVDPGFLAAHLAASGPDRCQDRVVIGRSTPDVRGPSWFHDRLRDWWNQRFDDLAYPGHRFAHTDLMSGNVSLPRALFDRLGGFDESLACREDYELGWRALAAGASFAYAAEAEGLHRDGSDPARNLRRVRAEGIADVAIAQRHPASLIATRASGLAASTASSRVLRALLFRMPTVAKGLDVGAAALMPLTERLGMTRAWDALSHLRWGLAYHGGVATAVGGADGLFALHERARGAWAPSRQVLDLGHGIEAALAAIEAAAPDECVLGIGSSHLGLLRAWPGMEPLGRRHLEAWLRRNSALWATAAALADRLPPLPRDDGPLPEAGWSVGELDLEDWTLRPVRQPLSRPLVTLVRRGPAMLGWVWLETGDQEGGDRREGALLAARRAVLGNADLCGNALRALVAPPGPDDPSGLPPMSIVVCTRDRTDSLTECLSALLRLDYPRFEIVVVDNAPTTDATARLVASLPDVRYVREDRPGLDWARNRGVVEASHALVAFTDDDTRVDRCWLRGIARAFEDPEVEAVTGLVAPMELGGEAQRYFEMIYGGMGKGLRPRRWSLKADGPAGILWASGCGVGANMAFRRAALERLGLFDVTLDVGTATRGGGDIEMFHRLLAAGGTLSYAPDAMVWHRHRADWDGLGRQLADNGSGFAAYLLAAWRRRTVPRWIILRFALVDWMGGWLLRRLIRPGQHRRSLVLEEASGLARSPFRVLRARRVAERLVGHGVAGGASASEGAPSASPVVAAANPSNAARPSASGSGAS